MPVRSLFVPRDVAGASRAIFALTTVSVLVLIAASVLSTRAGLPLWGLALTLPVVVASRLLRRVHNRSSPYWLAVPFAAVGLVVLLAATARGDCLLYLLFLFFPAMYAGRQLPKYGAYVIIGGCAVAAVFMTLLSDPAREALVEALFLDAVLMATMVRLALTGDRIQILLSQLEAQAALDPLTGLATRRRLDQAVTDALASGHPGGVTMILIDVDNFKVINDRYGHPAGDAVLVQVARCLKDISRAGDVIGRLGGDEIALLMIDMPLAVGFDRAEGIRRCIGDLLFTLPDHDPIEVSVSAGVAHAPTHACELSTLYASADRALYLAKQAGRNQVSVFTLSPIGP